MCLRRRVERPGVVSSTPVGRQPVDRRGRTDPHGGATGGEGDDKWGHTELSILSPKVHVPGPPEGVPGRDHRVQKSLGTTRGLVDSPDPRLSVSLLLPSKTISQGLSPLVHGNPSSGSYHQFPRTYSSIPSTCSAKSDPQPPSARPWRRGYSAPSIQTGFSGTVLYLVSGKTTGKEGLSGL